MMAAALASGGSRFVNVLFILADSLNRHFLPLHGNGWVRTPNIDRLAARGVVFTGHHCGSAPCMPARRELWTGNLEFPWRPWGSCEGFDEHLAALCARAGIPAHICTDHYHYWERGGANYLEQFSGADMIRGHENDHWVSDPCLRPPEGTRLAREKPDRAPRHFRNLSRCRTEADFSGPRTIAAACEWLDRNHACGPWFLAVECFDPHEPFSVPPPYDTMYGPALPDETPWPLYQAECSYPPEMVGRFRQLYAGKISMFDAWLGRLLDRLDRHRLWEDTVVVFTTDHGHYLGEHGALGKPRVPPWQTLFHIPLVIHAPGAPEGTRCGALSTAVDVHATLAEALGVAHRRPVHGRSLLPVVRGERASVRDAVLMGYWGSFAAIGDGRWKLHQAPVPGNRPLCAYGWDLSTQHGTLLGELRAGPGEVEAGDFMPHAGRPVIRLRIPPGAFGRLTPEGRPSLLFDLESDPGEERDLLAARPEEASRMRARLRSELEAIGAPAEQYDRLGL